MLVLDKEGYPVLTEDYLDLAITFSPVEKGRPGNDYHDASGKFTFLPSGIKFLIGRNLIENESSVIKKQVADRATALKANQIGAKLINGKVHVVFLKNGRRLHSFTFIQKDRTKKEGKDPDPKNILGIDITPQIKDEVIEAAREIFLVGKDLEEYLKKISNNELSPSDIASLKNLVEQQRLNDLVSYLHNKMRKVYKGAKDTDTIRLSVGRGYLKKLFAMLERDQIQEVLTRLQARGWKESEIQSTVIEDLPPKHKKIFEASYKKERKEKKDENKA